MWRIVPLIIALFLGFWLGQPEKHKKVSLGPLNHIHPEKEFPVVEHKSFVVVLYAYNDALWCERALSSIFEQDYDHYRVIVVDDGSIDETYERAKEFILKNNQDEKVILIRNSKKLGPVACLYRACDSCLDKEIVFPMNAKDWLSSNLSLQKLNGSYQNPDVWLTFGKTIHYPSYEIETDPRASFYAGIFKEIKLEDLFQNGHFVEKLKSYQKPLLSLAGGRVKRIEDPITFFNTVAPQKETNTKEMIAEYKPLGAFPVQERASSHADILIFSYDRPLQLYACLESIQRYITGFETLHVLYRSSTEQFSEGYQKVIDAFPTVHFVMQSMKDPKHDFKTKVNQILSSSGEYILFGVDDIIVKDFVDLKYCMDQMQKTAAYGFYLRMGRHITHCYQFDQSQSIPLSHPLSSGIYAWDFRKGESDWGFPNTLDMTLYRKELIKKPFEDLKYKTPNSLESNWASKYHPQKGIGLYFESSKVVNIPMNVVGRTGNPHMNYLNSEELLSKFNQGLKIDIEPLYQIENSSCHFDYIPEFVIR